MRVFPNVSSSEVYAENRRGAGPRTRITADTHKQARQQKRPRPIQKDNRYRDSQDNTNKNGADNYKMTITKKTAKTNAKRQHRQKLARRIKIDAKKDKNSNFNSLVLLVFLTRD